MSSRACAIYKSLKKPDNYLYVEKQGDFSKVPAPLLQLLGTLEWVMDIDISPDSKLARAAAAQQCRQLEELKNNLQLPPKTYYRSATSSMYRAVSHRGRDPLISLINASRGALSSFTRCSY